MARISGVDLPREKRVEIGLTYIYGIGRASADRILAAAGVNPDTRVKDLTDDEVKNIAAVIAGKVLAVESQICKGFAVGKFHLRLFSACRGEFRKLRRRLILIEPAVSKPII